ncbi:glycoside hydrolase family 18 protein [Parathielavia appendiculata]|uniref:Glycoside hydrolase family 18 protein n=1 Tax=Parathielavia appendiculata TaxID=2587402 RepID=A0AAN6Z172_9PEZI|nr:glycoside hydrolase family 18 protein [Parathielavia appendiculata]
MRRIDPALRPCGSAVLGGFDMNKQGEQAANFDTFAATLRSHFAADKSKVYFLSAAPGCSYPDKSVHPGYLVQSNFVWPRFYDDPEYGIASVRDSTAFQTRIYIGLSARLDTVFGLLGPPVREKLWGVMLAPDNGAGGMVTGLLVLIKEFLRLRLKCAGKREVVG